MNLSMKQKQTHRQTQRLWLPRGKGEGRDGLGVWGWQMQTVIYGTVKQQGPTV